MSSLASSFAFAWARLADLADGDSLTLRGVSVTLSPATRLPLANLLATRPDLLRGSARSRAVRPAGSLTRGARVTDPSKVRFAPRG
jgi:hypothetical protein